MNTIFNRQAYDANYNKGFSGRLRTFKQYVESISERKLDSRFDNLTAKQLEQIWNSQNGVCVCCGSKLTFETSDISHISKTFFFNKNNFQLLHHACNVAQRDLTMPFTVIKEMYGNYFLKLFKSNKTRDMIIEACNLDPKAVKRFDKLAGN